MTGSLFCKIRKNDLKCKEDAHGEKNVWRGEKWKKRLKKDTKEYDKGEDKHSRNKR